MKRMLFLTLLFFSLNLFSQLNFIQGKIILNNNDTITGEIDYRNDFVITNECLFRSGLNKPQTRYSPFDIKGYNVDSRDFVSKKSGENVYFMEKIIKGTISLYSAMDVTRNIHYYIDKNDSSFIELTYQEKTIDNKGARYLYKSKLHLGILKEYMKDAPSVFSKIDKIQTPNRENLTQLIAFYDEIAGDEKFNKRKKNQIVYIKISPEIKAGYIFRYKKPSVEFQRPNFNMCLSTYFSFPRIDDNIYLKVGVDLFNKGLNHVTIAFPPINITFPIGLEYRFDKGQKIIPKIYAGGHVLAPLINISPGVNIRLNEHYLISTNLDYVFVYPYPFYKGEKYVYSNFNCGLIYEF